MVELVTGLTATGVAGTVFAFLRSAAGKALVARVRGAVRSEATSLRAAVDNLAQVVAAQGDSIEWLRGELATTRAELEAARAALHDKETQLEQDNEKLRARVAELEAQVKALEAALAKKTRVKKTVKRGNV